MEEGEQLLKLRASVFCSCVRWLCVVPSSSMKLWEGGVLWFLYVFVCFSFVCFLPMLDDGRCDYHIGRLCLQRISGCTCMYLSCMYYTAES
jgi:hypothetical protein